MMSEEILVDTNVILRLFDSLEPSHTERSKRLFENARAGSLILLIMPPVLFEVAWYLRGSLKRSNMEVLDVLEAIISWPGVRVSDEKRVRRAIELGRDNNRGFADSYLAATAFEKDIRMVTFNERHFKKFNVPLLEME